MRSRLTLSAWILILVMTAGVAGVALALAGVATPARAPLVLVFLAVAPAVTIAGLLRRFDPLARLVIAVTGTIALNYLVAETMLQLGAWSPTGSLVVVLVIVAAGLAIQAGPVQARINGRLSSWQAAAARLAAPRDGETPAPPRPAGWRPGWLDRRNHAEPR